MDRSRSQCARIPRVGSGHDDVVRHGSYSDHLVSLLLGHASVALLLQFPFKDQVPVSHDDMDGLEDHPLRVCGLPPKARSEPGLPRQIASDLGMPVNTPVCVDANADVVCVGRKRLNLVPDRLDSLQRQHGTLDAPLQLGSGDNAM